MIRATIRRMALRVQGAVLEMRRHSLESRISAMVQHRIGMQAEVFATGDALDRLEDQRRRVDAELISLRAELRTRVQKL